MTLQDLGTIFNGTLSLYIITESSNHVWICIYKGDFDNLERDPIYNVYLDYRIIEIRGFTAGSIPDPENDNHLDVYVKTKTQTDNEDNIIRFRDLIKVVPYYTLYRFFTYKENKWTDITNYYYFNPGKRSELNNSEICQISIDTEKVVELHSFHPCLSTLKVYFKKDIHEFL